jgi:hypothetical protein
MSENLNEQPKRKRGQRGPGKKFQNQSQPQPQSEKSESNSDPLNDLLNVEVESHNSQPPEQEKGFGATLRRAAESSGLFDDSPAPSKAKKAKANQEEFNSLVIAVLTLGVSFANMRPEIKPNESELGVFSNHLTGILIRHLPIAKGLSADALDVIGIFAVISGYYARVSPELKRPAAKKTTPALYPEPIPTGPADPISDLSPEAGEFLRAAQSKTARD